MTRNKFIKKWLANPKKQTRDEMLNDLDLVIGFTNHKKQIFEEKLRKGIKMGLGSQGIWNPELENIMFNEIHNQALHDANKIDKLCNNLDKNFFCKNMCLTRCVEGKKFWK